jgi:HSP20 family protein
MATLQDRVDRLFQNSLGRVRGDLGEAFEGTAWSPAVDILETDSDLILRADLPGIDPKDVEVQFENGTLTLRGERKFESRVERVYGSFVRSFALPRTLDAEKVEAHYRNGVLEVKLPKRPEAKPKQIKVAVQ